MGAEVGVVAGAGAGRTTVGAEAEVVVAGAGAGRTTVGAEAEVVVAGAGRAVRRWGGGCGGDGGDGLVDADAGGVRVGQDPGDVGALVVEAAHGGGDVRPAGGGQDGVADQAFGHGAAQQVGPSVGAFRFPGVVRGDGLVDACGHAAHVGEEGGQVDAGVLESGELTGHERPVRVGHQVVQGALGQYGAQLLGGPALGEFLRVGADFLLLALVVLLGGSADGVGDCEDQPYGHRGGLCRF
ncbi:hypothetical protein [Streptomyces sp. SID4941]|uniref:hypothetical protein n=1 Tax=Streptomyces sp. SID4941 TaxID=2690283 RepID=UPI001926AD95|nr:hypothetical protein [Streptomyces sp. SID4941]